MCRVACVHVPQGHTRSVWLCIPRHCSPLNTLQPMVGEGWRTEERTSSCADVYQMPAPITPARRYALPRLPFQPLGSGYQPPDGAHTFGRMPCPPGAPMLLSVLPPWFQ